MVVDILGFLAAGCGSSMGVGGGGGGGSGEEREGFLVSSMGFRV